MNVATAERRKVSSINLKRSLNTEDIRKEHTMNENRNSIMQMASRCVWRDGDNVIPCITL